MEEVLTKENATAQMHRELDQDRHSAGLRTPSRFRKTPVCTRCRLLISRLKVRFLPDFI